MSLPGTRNKINPAKQLHTSARAGDFTGDGASVSSESISLSSEQVSMVREGRLVFLETLKLSDEQTSRSASRSFTERLTSRELKQAYLNSQIISGPERPVQTPVSTLTTGLGQGGLGQLGFGGTASVSG